MNNVLPTYWTGHREGEANAYPTLEAELKEWKKAFWVDDYVFSDLLMLLSKYHLLTTKLTNEDIP